MESKQIERLDILLSELNLSQSELCVKIGLSTQTATNWRSRGKISYKSARKIESVFGCNARWLMGDIDDMGILNLNSSNRLIAQESVSEYLSVFSSSEYSLIPVYAISASAGHGIENQDASPIKTMPFRIDWLERRGFKNDKLSIIRAQGYSMVPTIHSSDVLVVNLTHKEPIDGYIYVIRHSNDLMVKRIQLIPDGIRLVSDNNERYLPVDIQGSDLEQFEIVGLVVWVGHDFNY